HPPTTHGNEHSLHPRHVLQNLQSHRALSRDDFLVVVRRNDHVSMLGRQFFRLPLPFGAPWTDFHDLRAKARGGLKFDRGSILWHDDDRFGMQRAGGISYALRVVPAGIRNYSPRPLLRRERSNFVVRAPQLERADGLEVFELYEKAPDVVRP